MEKKLFILLFLTGIVPLVQSITRKFYLIQQSKTWTEAQTYCRTNHKDLATIETPADMIQLQAEAQEYQFSSSAWIGQYKDINNWRWSFKNEPLGSWKYWRSGEPDNRGGREECGFVYFSQWADAACNLVCPFVCYDDRFVGSDSFIYYGTTMKTWYDAQSYCRLQHTDLAVIRNMSEHSIILGKISPRISEVWIGLYRDIWSWSDQTNFSTITWASGQPGNNQGFEDCAYVQNGLVTDTKCSVMKPFFCYSVITGQQQIIRMKLQSDQDLNDPAVQAVILEQIQQNLKDHGIANVTVKFRKQPGGAVFHKLEEKKTAV